MTAISSMHLAVCGNRSEASIPLSPYFRKVRLLPSSLAFGRTNWYFASPNSSGFFWPSSSLSSGLGSDESMWLGPPAMKRKMTDVAFAGLGEGFGRHGVFGGPPKPPILKQGQSQR